MAEQLIKGASRRYVISNWWLDEYREDKSRFVDVIEIKDKPENSQYLQDLIAHGVNIDLDREQMRASFWINGFAVGDTDDKGDKVNCVYEEDDLAYNHVRSFIGAIEHPVRVRRVYPRYTQARDIEFLGVAKKSPAGQ